MTNPSPLSSPDMATVLSSLSNSNVFITGGTGFVGKVLIEKLMRCVKSAKLLYILVRPRKGQSAEQRLRDEIINSRVFDRLREEIGEATFEKIAQEKLRAVSGDLVQKELGIDKEMQQELIEKVDVIFHGAASIDFNLRLDLAIEMNVKGSLRVLALARQCQHLRAMVHISTAYVNCVRSGFVEERFYPIRFDPNELLDSISKLTVYELENVAVEGLIGDWPNTYTFTKFIAYVLIVLCHIIDEVSPHSFLYLKSLQRTSHGSAARRCPFSHCAPIDYCKCLA